MHSGNADDVYSENTGDVHSGNTDYVHSGNAADIKIRRTCWGVTKAQEDFSKHYIALNLHLKGIPLMVKMYSIAK